MSMNESVTSVSLLTRLRQSHRDDVSWREFVTRYGRRIYEWCIGRGLQAADAEDVTQDILVKLAALLCQFEYNPQLSFRGWLRTVTENAVKDHLRGIHQRKMSAGGSEIWRRLVQVEAVQELTARLDGAFDLELAEEAMSRVRARVAPNRWLAWQLTAREGHSGAEVAAELSMKVASVYTARNQIQEMIREEVERLEQKND